jgi:tetratricopeptide (TPR) repeat protein
MKQDWLIILDNADNIDTDYSKYFPSGARGVILITSRVPESSRYGTVGTEHLKSLDPKSCTNLLLSAADIPKTLWSEHEATADRVVNCLGSHTLALIQAGAYISQGYCPIEKYPEEYQRQCKILMEFSPKQAESRYCNVYATFEASAQILEASNDAASQDALDLLNLLAAFHYEKVPISLFEDAHKGAQWAQGVPEDDLSIDTLSKWHVSQLPQFMQVGLKSWDPFRLQRAQNLLRSLALVISENDGDFSTISMHPLAHTWSNIRQEQSLTQSLRTAGCIYALVEYGSRNWVNYGKLLRLHLEKFVIQQPSSQDDTLISTKIYQILFQCCCLLNHLRLDNILMVALKKLVQQLNLDPMEPVARYLEVHKIIAWNLRNMSNIEQAIMLEEKIIGIEKSIIDDDHPDFISSQYDLAIFYRDNNQLEDSIELLEHVVEVDKKMFRRDHPDLLNSQHVLASCYLKNGQIQEATELLKHLVAENQRLLREDNPIRLSIEHELGIAYRENGEYLTSIKLLEHVIAIYKKMLSQDHPDFLTSQYILATSYLKNGQTEDSIKLLEHVVEVRKHTLREDHPQRLRSQHELGRAYLTNGQDQAGIELLEHVVAISEKSLREGHLDPLIPQRDLAWAYLDHGKVENAIELLRRVVEAEKTLAEDDPNRLYSQDLLARAYRKHNQLEKSVVLLEHIVKVHEATLVEEHPARLKSEYRLARGYLANDRVEEAVDILERVVKIYQRTVDEGHKYRRRSEKLLSEASHTDRGIDTISTEHLQPKEEKRGFRMRIRSFIQRSTR